MWLAPVSILNRVVPTPPSWIWKLAKKITFVQNRRFFPAIPLVVYFSLSDLRNNFWRSRKPLWKSKQKAPILAFQQIVGPTLFNPLHRLLLHFSLHQRGKSCRNKNIYRTSLFATTTITQRTFYCIRRVVLWTNRHHFLHTIFHRHWLSAATPSKVAKQRRITGTYFSEFLLLKQKESEGLARRVLLDDVIHQGKITTNSLNFSPLHLSEIFTSQQSLVNQPSSSSLFHFTHWYELSHL